MFMPVDPKSTLPESNGHHLHSGVKGEVKFYRPESFAAEPAEENELAEGIRIVRRRLRLFGGVAIAITTVIWGWTLTRTPIYRGEFRVLVEPVANADPSRALLQDGPLSLSPNFDYSTQIEVLRSPALLTPIAEQLRQIDPDFRYGRLAESLQVTRLRDTKVLSVSYEDRNPEAIQRVLDEVSDSFLNYSFQQRQLNLQQGIQFVEGQLPELQERVDSLQQRLEQFRQEYSLIDPERRGGELSELISGVEKQRQETQTALMEARSLYASLQGQLGFNDQEALAASSLSESERYQGLLSQLREVEANIATESARFQPDSPNIIVLEDERASLLPLLDAEANRILQNFGGAGGGRYGNLTPTALELTRQLVNTANQVRQLEARRDALAQVEGGLKQEFAIVPALARQYTELQRELAVATDSLNRFLATRETLQIDAAQKSVPWELISEPRVAGQPVSPNVPRNLMLGAIAGLAAGVLSALLADKLDRVVHTPDDVKTIARLPILGMIPHTQGLTKDAAANGHGLSGQGGLSQFLRGGAIAPPAQTPVQTEAVTLGNGRSPYTGSPFFESFRSLAANLRFLSSDAPLRSIVISSPSPMEGKSTVAANLAAAAAEMGQRVLLVDADLRCPKIHERLGLPNFRGLSDLLTRDVELRQIVQTAPDNPFLNILTAGQVPPDPTKLLSSRRMRTLVEQFQTTFNLVIYDMPPILGFADATLVATHTDGLMMVVALGKTRRADLAQAIESIRLSPISLLGAVANGIRSQTASGYDGYHSRYYRSHYGAQAAAQAVGHHNATKTESAGWQTLPKTLLQKGATALSSHPKPPPPPSSLSKIASNPPPTQASSQSKPQANTTALSPILRITLISGVSGVVVMLWILQMARQWRTPDPVPPAPPAAVESAPALPTSPAIDPSLAPNAETQPTDPAAEFTEPSATEPTATPDPAAEFTEPDTEFIEPPVAEPAAPIDPATDDGLLYPLLTPAPNPDVPE